MTLHDLIGYARLVLALLLGVGAALLLRQPPVGAAMEGLWARQPLLAADPFLVTALLLALVGAMAVVSRGHGWRRLFGLALAAVALVTAYPHSSVDWLGLALAGSRLGPVEASPLGTAFAVLLLVLGYVALLHLAQAQRAVRELEQQGVEGAEVRAAVVLSGWALALALGGAAGAVVLLAALAGGAYRLVLGALEAVPLALLALGLGTAALLALAVYLGVTQGPTPHH